MDNLRRLLDPLLDPTLKRHINDIDIDSLSRIPAKRIQSKALPNIGLIELVSGKSFAEAYNELYTSNFQDGDRERSDLIVERLEDEFAGKRGGLAPYRIVGIRDQAGRAIAGAQFSILFLKDGRHAVPYLQYIYVRSENRRQDLSELLHTLILAVTVADAEYDSLPRKTAMRGVPFTLFETHPAADSATSGQVNAAAERITVHAKSGSQAMMIHRESGKLIGAHIQPGLEVGDPPMMVTWALRANPRFGLSLQDKSLGHSLVAAYYQSMRDEGFPEDNIAFAETMFENRCGDGGFVLMPLSEVTRSMCTDVDETVENHVILYLLFRVVWWSWAARSASSRDDLASQGNESVNNQERFYDLYSKFYIKRGRPGSTELSCL